MWEISEQSYLTRQTAKIQQLRFYNILLFYQALHKRYNLEYIFNLQNILAKFYMEGFNNIIVFLTPYNTITI